MAFGLAITALVAYLKSAMPIFGSGEQDGRGPTPEGSKAAPTPEEQVDERTGEDEKKEPQNTIHSLHPFPDTRPDLPAIVGYRFRAAVNEDSFSFPAGRFSPSEMPALTLRSGGPDNDNSPSSPGATKALSPPVDGGTDVPGGEPTTDIEEEGPEGPDTGGRKNRAPVTSGGVRLNDVLAGQAVLIGLSEFLVNSEDPDGDALSIRNVRVSAGSIGRSPEGWVYSSNRQTADQEVTVTYEVTDGQAAIVRAAVFRIEGKAPILGSTGDDLLAGLDSADQFDAREGDDIIDGKGGDDYIRGGLGDDHIIGGAGSDRIEGGGGNDIVFAGTGNDIVSGGAGNDRLYGEAGEDMLSGDDGDDMIDGGDGNDLIEGGNGNDTLAGGQGDDVMVGGAGSDTVSGGVGNDTIEDGAGADTVLAGTGDDVLLAADDVDADSYDGGEGCDTLDLTRKGANMVVDFAAGTVAGIGPGPDSMTGIEAMMLGAGDDTVVDGDGSQQVFLGNGDDILTAAIDGTSDCFDGEEGRDTLDLSNTSQGVSVNVTAGTTTGTEVGSDATTGFEVVVGGSGDDCFVVDTTASTAAVSLVGGDGNDRFQFDASAGPAASNVKLIHQILDFMVGDQVHVADYEFRKIRGDDGAERFERIYDSGGEGLDDDEFMIRLRDATTGEVQYAVIEVDRDRDDRFDFSVEIYSAPSSMHDPITA